MDDVFDEDADELTVSNAEHRRIMENIEKEGLVEGIGEGKEQVAQAAFNKGYEVAFKCIYELNLLKGLVSAFANTAKDKLDQLKVIHARLEALEKQFIDELAEDGRKEQPDSFVSSMDEVKRQLKDLNLVEDFDKFLQDAQGDDRETGQIAEHDDLEAEQDVKQGDQESSQDVQRSKESGQTASGGQ